MVLRRRSLQTTSRLTNIPFRQISRSHLVMMMMIHMIQVMITASAHSSLQMPRLQMVHVDESRITIIGRFIFSRIEIFVVQIFELSSYRMSMLRTEDCPYCCCGSGVLFLDLVRCLDRTGRSIGDADALRRIGIISITVVSMGGPVVPMAWSMNLHVFPEAWRVGVGLVAAVHSTVVRLVGCVNVRVLFSVWRVGETSVAAFVFAFEGFFAWNQKKKKLN